MGKNFWTVVYIHHFFSFSRFSFRCRGYSQKSSSFQSVLCLCEIKDQLIVPLSKWLAICDSNLIWIICAGPLLSLSGWGVFEVWRQGSPWNIHRDCSSTQGGCHAAISGNWCSNALWSRNILFIFLFFQTAPVIVMLISSLFIFGKE